MPEHLRNRLIRNPRRNHAKTGWLDLFSPGPVVPWTKAYRSRKKTLISETLRDEDLMVRFRNRESLPSGYGIGIDERCVEYPWLIARLSDEPERYLDAGSTHNHPMILETGFFDQKEMHIVTLHPEPKCYWRRGISYLFADIRDLPIKDGFYGTISSISTLEHVGMDNRAYTGGRKMGAPDSRGFVRALQELDRVLEPGGDLHVTVPFGRFADLATSLVFDADLLRELIRATPLELVEETYYRYRSSGWQIATSDDCADADFVEWAVQPVSSRFSVFPLQQDGAAAARAVACLHFRKDQKTA